VVVMNADGSRGVTGALSAGAELPDLGWIGGLLIGAGAVLLAIGALLLFLGLRSRGEPPVN
jgi:hypothetical protein